jgi:hypothetical protein
MGMLAYHRCKQLACQFVTQLHLVSGFRIHDALRRFTDTSSWRGSQTREECVISLSLPLVEIFDIFKYFYSLIK